MQDLASGLELYQSFARRVVELGGSVSAEHGIGKLKGKFLRLMFPPEALQQMRAVKNALDPDGLLNPGDILPVEVAQ